MADAVDTVKLNEEEQAAVDRAQKALEANKAMIGQTLPQYEPMWLLTPPGRKVLERGLGRDPVTGELHQVTDATVTAVIPRTFSVYLDHHHRIELVQGIREIPAVLMLLGPVLNNGVKPYESTTPPPPKPVMLLGSSSLGDPVRVGDRMMPLGPWVVQAQAESGMSPEDWNALPDVERTGLIQAEIGRAAAAAPPVPNAGGSEVAKVPPQPAKEPKKKG
jgi:hypothetical protein